jgi:transketolase
MRQEGRIADEWRYMRALSMTALSSIDFARLDKQAARTRMRSLRMVHRAKLGHPGGDFSSADILTALYGAVLHVDPCNPHDPDRDRFIMSKGHCSGVLYATLEVAGFLTDRDLDAYMAPLSKLNGHPDRNKIAGVEANTGALGHGLPIAVGCALAAKMSGASWRTFVLVGDGELQEGSNWEAGMCAAQYKLDNLVLIIDRNRLQQGDFTENTICMEPMVGRWRSFGWDVHEIDGHDIRALAECFQSAPFTHGKPSCVVAHTTKGKGVSFMENRPEWHHHAPTDDELQRAIGELKGDQP